MTKALTGLLIAASVLAFGGCGGGAAPEAKKSPAATVTVTARPTPSDDSTDPTVSSSKREEIYVQLVHENIPSLAHTPDSTLLDLGHTICDTVKVDSPLELTLGLVKGLTDNGFTGREAGEMLGFASALCPEKQNALTIDR